MSAGRLTSTEISSRLQTGRIYFFQKFLEKPYLQAVVKKKAEAAKKKAKEDEKEKQRVKAEKAIEKEK